jgi:hypothetical protein
MSDEPAMRLLSLGAGVQSTTLLILSARGELPKLDAAIFSDTGWEPREVYEHLDRLEREVAAPAGIPIHRVARGNLRDDLLNPDKMSMIPAYTLGPARTVTVIDESRVCTAGGCRWHERETAWLEIGDPEEWGSPADGYGESAAYDLAVAEFDRQWDDISPCSACANTGRIIIRSHTEQQRSKGMQSRKCTVNYKLAPIRTRTRLLLGAPAREPAPCRYCNATGERVAPWRAKRGEQVTGTCSVCDGSGHLDRVGQPPAGAWAEQWVGFSTDEIVRVSGHTDTRYSRSRHPLLELGMSREQCIAYLRHHGWDSVAKSACTGCPFHGNKHWREMRDKRPAEFAEAVEFDRAYRTGLGMNSERFLHLSCLPLDQAPIDVVRRGENIQLDILDAAYAARLEDGEPDGCSPYGCRSGEPVSAGTP